MADLPHGTLNPCGHWRLICSSAAVYAGDTVSSSALLGLLPVPRAVMLSTPCSCSSTPVATVTAIHFKTRSQLPPGRRRRGKSSEVSSRPRTPACILVCKQFPPRRVKVYQVLFECDRAGLCGKTQKPDFLNVMTHIFQVVSKSAGEGPHPAMVPHPPSRSPCGSGFTERSGSRRLDSSTKPAHSIMLNQK